MADRKCTRCGVEKPLDQFPGRRDCKLGRSWHCQTCKNEWQRAHRLSRGNLDDRRYEKSKRGFLMRAYRNMQSRVVGIQWRKHHLYAGKSLLSRATFYEWSLASPEFHRLFDEWESANHEQRLTPSVDRVDSSRGYDLDNMQWVTHSENSRRGSMSRHYGHMSYLRRKFS